MKQTLIKITDDHYVVVDDSEIKEGDYYLKFTESSIEIFIEIFKYRLPSSGQFCKKITHSTPNVGGFSALLIAGIKELSLSEVKELIGEVDVEKKGAELAYSRRIRFGDDFNSGVCYGLEEGYVIGYNQAIEDNKEKKYTEEDIIGFYYWLKKNYGSIKPLEESQIRERTTDIGILNKYIQSLQPKTQWEVTFDEQDKLRLV